MRLSKVFPCLRKKEAQKQPPGNNGGAGNANFIPNTGTTPPKVPPIDNIPDDFGNQEAKPPSDEAPPKEESASNKKISQHVWDRAYDELADADDTKDLVEAYAKVIPEALKPDEAEKATETGDEQAAAEMKNPDRRRELMQGAVKAGTEKISKSKSTKASDAAGKVSGFILKFKDTIDLAISTNPQAALPWAGVCIGLQVGSPPGPASVSD
jgi:hypothetical protein